MISESKLSELINRENVDIYIFLLDDTPCGYVELVSNIDFTEILYFGLFPEFSGRGLGAPCLRMAVELVWNSDPGWIELNTCDLDSERALRNNFV